MTIKRYFTLLNILFITGMVYFGVKGLYRLVTSQMEVAPVNQTISTPEASAKNEIQHPLSYYNSISDRNLFKTKEKEEESIKEEVKEEDVVEDLEETSLKLKLWGTVSGAKDITYAVIEDIKEKKQNLYREGDMLQGAIIKEILRAKVILNVNGKDEMLNMEENGSKNPRDSRREIARNYERPTAPKSQNAKDITIGRGEIDEAMSDVNKLMGQARVKPHFNDGKPDGLVFSRVRSNSIFKKLGLRSGDILTGINGAPIESVDDALNFYNSLKSSENVAIQIKRRGKEEAINYTIEE